MYKVLLVDDEPFILSGMQKMIFWEEHGLEIVQTKKNGREALDFLEKNIIDVLITDIKMPKMDGIELLKEVRALKRNIKCIILSGYTEFEYVKKATVLGIENYLVKPIDEKELVNTLVSITEKLDNEMKRQSEYEKGIEVLKNNIILRWIHGEIGEEELAERKKYLDCEVEGDFMVCIIRISKREQPESQLINPSMNKILRAIKFNIEEQNMGFVVEDLSGNILVMFYQIQEHLAHIGETLKNCLHTIHNQYKCNCIITTGDHVTSPSHVYRSYKKAKTVQEYNLLYGRNEIISYAQYKEKYLPDTYSIYEKLPTLFDKFDKKDESNIFAILDEMAIEVSNGKAVKLDFLYTFSILIVNQIINNIKNFKASASGQLEGLGKTLDEVYQLEVLEDIISWTKQMIHKAFVISEQINQTYSQKITKVITYLDINYEKDINLKTVSYDFKLNSLYLGQLFKQEIGVSFNMYLNSLRIERAKQLLEYSDLNIKQIAEKIGYLNSNYFCTIFKKYTGMSPMEFKKK